MKAARTVYRSFFIMAGVSWAACPAEPGSTMNSPASQERLASAPVESLARSPGHHSSPTRTGGDVEAARNHRLPPRPHAGKGDRPRHRKGGGSGKFYMGREISSVMGNIGLGWLERPERESEERTDLLVEALALKSTDAVADIGAGTGYLALRIATLVRAGVVYVTEIQQEMLDILSEQALTAGAENVVPVLGKVDRSGLAKQSIDLALLVDAYHEFSYPREMMESVVAALKPGGRVALVEYRLEDPRVRILACHKMTAAQARFEMEAVGLEFVEQIDGLPQQHLLIFRRPMEP